MSRTQAWAGAAVVLILTAVLIVVLTTRGGTPQGGPAATATSLGPTVTSPYDFTEADTPVAFNTFGDAKFISLTLDSPNGTRSYLLAHDSAGFATIIAALAGARKTAGGSVATTGETAGTDTKKASPSLTVVMADRTTYTFVLDLKRALLVRGGQAWTLPGGDLKTLVEKAAAE